LTGLWQAFLKAFDWPSTGLLQAFERPVTSLLKAFDKLFKGF
jgi:hypothetical protein